MFITAGSGSLSLAGVGITFRWLQGFVDVVGLFVGSKTSTGQFGFDMKYSIL